MGACQALVEEAVKYARERKQFGQEIGKFQMVQEQIARMVVETEAARLMVYRCAYEKDQGIKNTLETSMAKYFACEVVSCVAGLALLILGAYGYSGVFQAQRHKVKYSRLYFFVPLCLYTFAPKTALANFHHLLVPRKSGMRVYPENKFSSFVGAAKSGMEV